MGEAVKRALSFTRRNLGLYFFWFTVLLAPTIVFRGWFDHGFLFGVFDVLRSFVFGSTFIASWFIMALIISVWLVLLLSMVARSKSVLLMTVPAFIVCCLMSNYRNAPFVAEHIDALVFLFGDTPYNSFWAGLFWVALGKVLADYLAGGIPSSRSLVVLGLCGMIALALEQVVIVLNHFSVVTDSFFSLPLIVAPIFLLTLKWNCKLISASFFRAASTVTYCLHATLRFVLVELCGFFGYAPTNLCLLAPVVFICLLTTWIVLKGEGRKGLRWLRYAH